MSQASAVIVSLVTLALVLPGHDFHELSPPFCPSFTLRIHKKSHFLTSRFKKNYQQGKQEQVSGWDKRAIMNMMVRYVPFLGEGIFIQSEIGIVGQKRRRLRKKDGMWGR